MEDELEGDTEIFLNNNPPKEAPPPLPPLLGPHNLPPEVFGPCETEEESPKAHTRPWWTRRGPPPPVPPRASSGQAKLLSFKKMRMSGGHSQSDVRALLGKQTGHLEEVLTRQKGLEQDLKRLLQFNLGQSQASRSMTGDVSQEEEFDNGTLETCLVSNGVRAQKHGEGLLLEMHVHQAADLVYQAKMTTTATATMMMMGIRQNYEGWEYGTVTFPPYT